MRIKGSVSVSTNYEPSVSGPFDARSLVQYKADLFKDSTWRRQDGVSYIYNGMLVGVYKDSIENNGYYILQDKENFNLESSWLKLVDINKLDEINKRIDDIDPNTSGGAMQVPTRGDLPSIGEESKIYFVITENATYRWDNPTLTYKCCGRDYTEIKAIDGGSASLK